MNGAKFKKTGHVTTTTPIKGYSVISRLAFDIFYLHTKFGDSLFSHSGDMISDIKTENESCDPDHAPFRRWFVVCRLGFDNSTCMQNLMILV